MTASADFNGDSQIDGADVLAWQSQWGAVSTLAAISADSISEPTAPANSSVDLTAIYQQQAIDLAWVENIGWRTLTPRLLTPLPIEHHHIPPPEAKTRNSPGTRLIHFFENWDEFAAHTH